MLARTFAPALFGADGRLVSIECDITNGLPGLVVVGLGDKAVAEAKERLRSAIKNSGLLLPPRRITVNLAPADLPKDGSGYDLGMAIAILSASGQIDPSLINDCLFLGELALDGSVRPARGALVAAQLAGRQSLKRLFIAKESAHEAALLDQTKIFAVSDLLELYRHLLGDQPLASQKQPSDLRPIAHSEASVDLASIYGQTQAKRAIEIATAGSHNILLSGPPGTGKSLLAKAVVGLLPEPTTDEIIEITKLHNLAGSSQSHIISQRPFRSPHHSTSSAALIGGGTTPRPGEVSLAHGGVLFLDELPEFPRPVLEVLRQPLEDGSITIARAAGVITYPSQFMLIATRNSCPCGYFGDPSGRCHCDQAKIYRYQRKISGPLLDRIDLVVDVPRVDTPSLIHAQHGEPSKVVAERINAARAIQRQRLSNSRANTNATMSISDIEKYCKINNKTIKLASNAMESLGLSARGYNRILKVARTIADLASAPQIEIEHFTEALQYRPRVEDNLSRLLIPESNGTQYRQNRYAKTRTTGLALKQPSQ